MKRHISYSVKAIRLIQEFGPLTYKEIHTIISESNRLAENQRLYLDVQMKDKLNKLVKVGILEYIPDTIGPIGTYVYNLKS
jgi:hypothetical protein